MLVSVVHSLVSDSYWFQYESGSTFYKVDNGPDSAQKVNPDPDPGLLTKIKIFLFTVFITNCYSNLHLGISGSNQLMMPIMITVKVGQKFGNSTQFWAPMLALLAPDP